MRERSGTRLALQVMRFLGPTLALVGAALLVGGRPWAQSLPPEAVVALSPEQASELVRSPRWLALRAGGFDTRGNEPEIPADLRRERRERGGPTCFLVQFSQALTPELRTRVEQSGATLLEYLPTNAFLVRGTPAQRAALERVAEVAWSGELHPAWRIESRLRDAAAEPAGAEIEHELVALGFRGGARAALELALRRSGATVLDTTEEQDRWVARVRASATEARRAAREDALQWIESAQPVTLRNNSVAWVVQTNQNQHMKVWDRGLRGEGQVIGHIDSAISVLNNCWLRDPSGAPVGPTHRKVVYLSSSGADVHGMHTAGTLAGDAQPVTGSTLGRGIAYLARLAHTDLPIANYSATATAHAGVGARIHSNSWGVDSVTSYSALCASIDGFQWANEDHLAVFSVSNGAFVTSPENAKNVLAVGSTENGANADQFCFGGLGPTSDGRRRPEIMAPGCNVTSAAPGTCATGVLNGTSMATAAVAGAAALAREYFMDGFYPSGRANNADAFVPSGALLKAVLVNSGQDLSSASGYPSLREGWGRINLDRALHFVGDESKLFATELRHAAGLSTGQMRSWSVHVQSSAVPFEVTLAFMDAPGSVNAALAMVNDLDLEVVSPSGMLYLGNAFTGGVSSVGGGSDPLNNVERVVLASPEVGTWSLRVRGANVPLGPQGLGLCATGDLSFGGTSSPTRYCTTSQTTNFCAPRLQCSGVARAGAASGFTLAAADVEGQRQGLVYYGTQGRTSVRWTFQSTSFWCVRPPVQRMSAQSSGGTLGGCDGLLFVDWNAWVASRPDALGAPFGPGALVQAQAWFRDPLAPGQGNLTDALEFTVQP